MFTDTTQATEPGLLAFQMMACPPQIEALPGEPGRVHLGLFSDEKYNQEPAQSMDSLLILVFGE